MSEWDAGSREFEELVDAVLRERSRVEPRAELAGRMLAGIEAAAREREVRVRWWRRPSPGWLGLGSLAGVAAVMAVGVFGGGAFRDGRRVPASQAKESAPVRLSAPVAWTKSAEVGSVEAAHVPLRARVRLSKPMGSSAGVAVAKTSTLPKLETFPSAVVSTERPFGAGETTAPLPPEAAVALLDLKRKQDAPIELAFLRNDNARSELEENR